MFDSLRFVARECNFSVWLFFIVGLIAFATLFPSPVHTFSRPYDLHLGVFVFFSCSLWVGLLITDYFEKLDRCSASLSDTLLALSQFERNRDTHDRTLSFMKDYDGIVAALESEIRTLESISTLEFPDVIKAIEVTVERLRSRCSAANASSAILLCGLSMCSYAYGSITSFSLVRIQKSLGRASAMCGIGILVIFNGSAWFGAHTIEGLSAYIALLVFNFGVFLFMAVVVLRWQYWNELIADQRQFERVIDSLLVMLNQILTEEWTEVSFADQQQKDSILSLAGSLKCLRDQSALL